MIIGICSGGPIEEVQLPRCDGWIGVDRGAIYLLEQGITPVDVVGDFDSVTADEFARLQSAFYKVQPVQAEKDETDTELAIETAVRMQPKRIYITGVTGGRLDHFEAAVRILARYQLAYPEIEFFIVNRQNEFAIWTPGQYKVQRSHYQYISFFAMQERVEKMTLRGVKYETTDETIDLFGSRFTSNEIIAQEASISFERGICLVIRSND